MAVKMRLQRKGRKKAPFYHIVIADGRSPRDGRFIEKLGTYNPMTKPATIEIDRDKAFDWIIKGAQPTDTVRAILRFKGVMFRKHLNRGVTKGALTQEAADQLYQEWIDKKEAKVASRIEKTKAEKRDYHAKVFGTPAAKPVTPEPVAEEVEETVAEAAAEEAEEVAETPAAAEEETPATDDNGADADAQEGEDKE
ncbi:MAG: 30S ribosomal protein S16 [Saprospiraceae bacterium]